MSLAKRAIEEFGACQKGPELEQLIAYLADVPLHRVLEIGTQDGGTLWVWHQLAEPDAVIVSVDIEALACLDLALENGQHRIYVNGDSHDPATYAQVREFLGGEPLDLLFIDGDHTYDGVRKDFEDYSPLVRPGGVIALHDVVEHEYAALSEVERFWLELLPGHPEALAFVDDSRKLHNTWRGSLPPMSCGIGVIRQR